MILFRRLVTLKLTFLKLNEIPSGIQRYKFQQLSTFMVCGERHWKFLRRNLIFAKYSTDSKGNFTVPGLEKNVQELKDIEKEMMDEDDFENEDDPEYDDVDHDEEEEQTESNKQRIFEEIAEGNPEVLNQLKNIDLELVLMKEMGVSLPTALKKRHWEELLRLPSIRKKGQYLAFLYNIDRKNIYKRNVKIYKKEKALEKMSQLGFHYYGLSGHTMFYRIYDSSVRKLLNHRQLTSKLKILFDCSYQEYMTPRGIKNCAKQIALCVSNARLHRVSSHIGFCNLDKNDELGKILPFYFKYLNYSLYNESHKNYLDLYPREKIIYLSPHGSDDLMEVNEDHVYIIGSYIDKGYGLKASLAKAKENNVRAARFPIDYYLAWKEGNKALTLPVVLDVLLDMAYYNDWYRAFKNIPNRFYFGGTLRKKFHTSDTSDDLILKCKKKTF